MRTSDDYKQTKIEGELRFYKYCKLAVFSNNFEVKMELKEKLLRIVSKIKIKL